MQGDSVFLVLPTDGDKSRWHAAASSLPGRRSLEHRIPGWTAASMVMLALPGAACLNVASRALESGHEGAQSERIVRLLMQCEADLYRVLVTQRRHALEADTRLLQQRDEAPGTASRVAEELARSPAVQRHCAAIERAAGIVTERRAHERRGRPVATVAHRA
jgi:hypothetical protein